MAEMVATNQFRNGMHISIEGQTWRILEFQHHKPGKGAAVMRTKLKNLDTGSVVEKTFRTSEKFERLHTESNNAQYLYDEGDNLVFMDPETYEQTYLPKGVVGDDSQFLQDGMTVQILLLDGEPRSVQLPTTVELKVVETEPAVRGDTVGNVTKPAKLENGTVVQVPAFVDVDDMLKIDTRSASYMSRA